MHQQTQQTPPPKTDEQKKRIRRIRLTIMIWIFFIILGVLSAQIYKFNQGNYSEENLDAMIKQMKQVFQKKD